MTFTRRATLAFPALAFPALLAAPALRAQPATPARSADPASWAPSRSIRLIVTYPPGGVTDIVGRLVADPLGRELGQAVVVENRAGAGGNIGTQAAVQAEPDGYTLMLGTTALFGVNPILYAASGVDALRDLMPIGMTGEAANVLSVLPRRVRATSVAELVAEAKARPLIYGSVGNGSSSHLSALRFLQEFGIEATHVPYRGSAPLVAAMLANEVDFGFDTTATSTAHVRAGTFRALAVTTAQRASALPDVPTVKESGLPDYDMGIWFGVFAPRRVPAPIAARLTQAMTAIRTSAQEARLRNAFVDPVLVPPERMQAYVETTARAWQAIARTARISAD